MQQRPVSAFNQQPWRFHEVLHGLAVEDVWAFAMPGAGPDDFPRVMAAIREGGTLKGLPGVAGALFAIRWALGRLLRVDGAEPGGESLWERLPADLRTAAPVRQPGMPFVTLYETHAECVNEIRNRTVHAAQHLGWVRREDGHELQMTVLVQPQGSLGHAYMALIAPFRHRVVYPRIGAMWENAWLARQGS